MVIFNKKWKKYNEIQLTKNIMDLNIRKMTNHPPSPDRAVAVSEFRAVALCQSCGIVSELPGTAS